MNTLSFTNRHEELKILSQIQQLTTRNGSQFIVVTGRRRVGKSRLLTTWVKSLNGMYTQAIEGNHHIQLEQIARDLLYPGSPIKTKIHPKNWEELFELIERTPEPLVICIDEFPYLVNSDPTLPSRMQKWLDTLNKRNLTLVCAGSSRRMMYDIFINNNAPLYGRASKILNIAPMGYREFCGALQLDYTSQASFHIFSLVGGVPKYWELVDTEMTPVEIASDLYFSLAPYMQGEPRRVLKDERLDELYPHSVLEVIGRGASRPSEIAARLNTKQQNLSRVLQLMSEAHIISRELSYGTSARAAKHTLYKITDPALRFWYQVYSLHQSRWSYYPLPDQEKLLHDHAASVFEDYCRTLHRGSSRAWVPNAEFDIVAPTSDDPQRVIVGEVKYATLTEAERRSTRINLEQRWLDCALSKKFKAEEFIVYDLESALKRL